MSQLLSLMGSPIVRRIAGITSLLVAVVIAILSLVPGQDLPDVHLSDKVEHAIAYLVLAGLICFWLGRERIVRGTIVAVGYGAVLEFAQALAGTGRTPSLLDAGANLLGACIGAGLAWIALATARPR
ncbi:VanZ family protein [Hyphomonas oceanitis]|uniref:VanZ family protein n=1 Tax=Hyphomonas oceanitis TaxID=81033 RepID=UPI003001E306